MTDEIMSLVHKRQQMRYKHQNADVQEDINAGTFKNADISGIKALAVVVYDITTKDKPGWYIARIFDADSGKPTNYHICRRTYEEIAQDIIRAFPGLISFPRGTEDEPQIIEVWL